MSSIGKYDVYKVLGMGGFAKVKLGINKENDETCALKIMKRDEKLPEAFFNLIQNEVDILKSLSHKHIIKFIEYYERHDELKEDGTRKNVFCIVLEFAKNGELFHYLADSGAFPEPISRYYFHQLIDAIEYLHD